MKKDIVTFIQKYSVEIISLIISTTIPLFLIIQFDKATAESIIIGILTEILILCFSISYKSHNNDEEITEINKSVTALKNYANIHSNLSKFRFGVEGNKSVIKEISNDILKQYLDDIKPLPNGFFIRSEYWISKSYVAFWSHLVREQKIRKMKNKPCFIMRATHSIDINFWLDTNWDADTLFSYQQAFINNGGKIIRILLGNEEKPSTKYLEVIKRFNAIGIEEVLYTQRPMREELKYDFLLLYEERIVSKWYSGQYGQKFAECEYIEDVDDNIILNWRIISEKAMKDANYTYPRFFKSIPLNRQNLEGSEF